jgi:hypothetical protein
MWPLFANCGCLLRSQVSDRNSANIRLNNYAAEGDKRLDTWKSPRSSEISQIKTAMKTVNPTRCYTMVYRTLWFAQHVSGIIMPIIRILRLYRWPQRVAPHLGYGWLLVWCMAVGLSVRVEGCCTWRATRPATCHNQGEVPYAGAICIVASSWWWA